MQYKRICKPNKIDLETNDTIFNALQINCNRMNYEDIHHKNLYQPHNKYASKDKMNTDGPMRYQFIIAV